jgi:mannosyltransferase OCH1-like enzyme
LIGQILDEFFLDGDALRRLLEIRALPPERQVAPLRNLVQQVPDHTPAALLLLVALRQSGQFHRPKGTDKDIATAIPRRIAQFWDSTEPPAEITELTGLWRNSHPNFEYQLFNDSSARQFLARHYPPAVVNAFQRAREPAQKADLFRLAYLGVNGGFYIDVDDRCLGKIDDHVAARATLCLYQEDYGTIGNDFMGAVPQHPVIRRALDQAIAAIGRGDEDMPWLCTGPGLITRAFAQAMARGELGAGELLNSAVVFDTWQVQQFVGLHCVLGYKKTKKHWVRSVFRQGV